MPTDRELIDALCRVQGGWARDIPGDEKDYRAASEIVQAHGKAVSGKFWTSDEKRLGDAINDALYRTPYNGTLNVPCLSPDQRRAAAQAALEVFRHL